MQLSGANRKRLTGEKEGSRNVNLCDWHLETFRKITASCDEIALSAGVQPNVETGAGTGKQSQLKRCPTAQNSARNLPAAHQHGLQTPLSHHHPETRHRLSTHDCNAWLSGSGLKSIKILMLL